MNNPLRSKRTEWVVTLPGFLWLALFFAIPALIVLAFTFHGHDASGGVGEWSLSTLVSCVIGTTSALALHRWRAVVAGSIMLPFWTSFVVRVFAWKTMLHPDGWLQACYCAWLRTREWLFSWLPAAVQKLLVAIGAASSEPFSEATSTILDSEAAVVLVSVYSFLPFAIMPIYTAAEKFDFSLRTSTPSARSSSPASGRASSRRC